MRVIIGVRSARSARVRRVSRVMVLAERSMRARAARESRMGRAMVGPFVMAVRRARAGVAIQRGLNWRCWVLGVSCMDSP